MTDRACRRPRRGLSVTLAAAILHLAAAGVVACPWYDPGTPPPAAEAWIVLAGGQRVKETRVAVGGTVSFQATGAGQQALPDSDWDTDRNVNYAQGAGTFKCEWDFSYVYVEQPPNYGFNVEASAGVNAQVQHTFNSAGTYIVKVRSNDVFPGTWCDDSPRLGTSVTVYVGIPVWDAYPEGGGISCAGVSAPLAGYGYACNSLVTCTIAQAADQDHRYDPATGQHTHPLDTFAKENAYVWTAEAGGFVGTNKGRTVTWLAPDAPNNSVKITCRVDDDADIPAGETGTRNDPYKDYSVTVKVYKVRCLKVEATYDVDIYWPAPEYDPPGFFDKVWAASVSTYQQDGTVVEDWPRARIADVFHVEPPQQQHYKLTCTFYRYPSCVTEQELTTTVQFAGISGQTEVSGWAPQVTVATRNSVGRRSYTMTFTFKVGGRQVENAQTVPQGEHTFVDFAIWGEPTCPPEEFTKDHLYFATDCGEAKSEQPDIAHKVLHEVNPLITSGCICNTSFENIWQGAKGPTKGGHSDGACCCRAKGMIEVLQVLGFDYVQDFVNEMSEPNSERRRPDNEYCSSGWPWHWGWYMRLALGVGGWNNWQGVCKAGNGATCYSPQGRHESVYETMNDAPNYPERGPGGTEYAFIQYSWLNRDAWPSLEHCTHLPTPP